MPYHHPSPSRKPRRAPMTGAVDARARAEAWGSYRESLNPVRGLTISRAVSLVESYPRGEYADLMWTFGAPFTGIECADPDLSTIIGRRTDALAEMDWNALPGRRGDNAGEVDAALADEQAAYVRDLVNGIGNLYEAIDHLAVAFHRGFAHLEIIDGPDGGVEELRPVDQWNIVRDGCKGAWKYNPGATQTTYRSLPEDLVIDPAHFIIRTVPRPVGRVSLVKFIRQNLTEKDWSAFLELYGTLSGVVIGPPDVPTESEALYRTAAEEVATGGSGYLPHGSDYRPNPATEGRGTEVFEKHLRYLTEKLVLVGTSGKLTMLAESGSGTLAGGAHAEAFQQLARADARRVSEILQEQLIAPRLRAAFPGREISAYFELAFREEVDASKVVEDAAKLAGAGYQIDPAELSEKTGYRLILRPEVAKSPSEVDTGDRNTPSFENAQGMHRGIGVSEGEDRGNGQTPPTIDSVGKIENRETRRKSAPEPEADRIVDAAGNATLTQAAIRPIGDGLAEAVEAGDLEALRQLAEDMPDLVDLDEIERVLGNAAAAGLEEALGDGERIRNADGRGCGSPGGKGFSRGNTCGKGRGKGTSREPRSKRHEAIAEPAGRRDPRSREEIERHKNVMRSALERRDRGEGGLIDLAELPPAATAKLQQAGGPPGRVRIEISPQHLKHQDNAHGGEGERLRGQLPLNDDDFIRRLPLAIVDPDDVQMSGRKGKDGQDRFEFTRRIRDTHTVVVEVRTGGGRGVRGVPITQIKNAANRARPMEEPPAVTSLTVTRAWLRENTLA